MSTRATSAPLKSTKKRTKVKRKVPKSAKTGKELQRARKQRQIPDEARKRALADPDRMWRLRMKFIEQAKRYFGVPYAKKYWKPEDKEYSSPIFLDCCGLVRRVMRDLQKDFGFRMGPWNQAYQHDTLPIVIDQEEDMKPGDLVFISAIYHNPKTKKQRHNLTHVEIWLGDGPKTIGARWQKGKVQVFDSYRFRATSYHSERYIFKSLDTWLMGICRSHCPEHTWKMRAQVFKPIKKSIFHPEEKGKAPVLKVQEDEPEEGAGDTDDELVMAPNDDMGVTPADQLIHEALKTKENDGDKTSDVGKAEQVLAEIESRFVYRQDGGGSDSDDDADHSLEEDQDFDDIDKRDSVAEIAVEQCDSDTEPAVTPRKTHVIEMKLSGSEAADSTSASNSSAKYLSYSEKDWGSSITRVDSGNGSLEQSSRASSASSSASFLTSGIVTDLKSCSISTVLQMPTGVNQKNIPNTNNSSNDSDAEEEDEGPPSVGGYVMQSKIIQMAPSSYAAPTEDDTGEGDSGLPPTDSEGTGAVTPAGKKKEPRKADTERNIAARSRALAAPKEPTFYIGGNNGVSLVESALTDMGWKRITDKYNETYKLKWVECKSNINYAAFKEGDQLVNRIPNCHLLTNKLGLLNSLQRYERVQTAVNGAKYSRIKSTDFLPETYRIDDSSDRKIFLDVFQDGEVWICKPTGMNQGKGIYLVRDIEEFKRTLEERDEKKQKSHRPAMDRIVQRYIANPLLLDGRKFDIRAYMLIASTIPFVVLYHKGYVRLCLHEYDTEAEDLTAHLTNQFVQKKDAEYQNSKESTVWSMDKLNEYINSNLAEDKGLEQDWVYNGLTSRMKQIMTYCFKAVQHKLKYKLGYFDLYGLDFMIDENMKVWLIEINVNPCLAVNCEGLKEVVPGVVREAIHLSIECFEKQKRSKPIIPLDALKNYHLLYTESSKSYKSQNRAPGATSTSAKGTAGLPPVSPRAFSPRARSLSPVNRNRSISPTKEASNSNNNALSATAPMLLAPGSQPPTFKPSEPVPSHGVPDRPKTPRGTALQQSPFAQNVARSSLPNINRANSAGLTRNCNTASQDSIKFRLTHTLYMRKKSSSSPASPEIKPRPEKPERQTLALRTISAKYSSAEYMDKAAALSPSSPSNQAKKTPIPSLTGFKHPKSPNHMASQSQSISAALVPNAGVAGEQDKQKTISTVLLTPANTTNVTQATADLNHPPPRTPVHLTSRPASRSATTRQRKSSEPERPKTSVNRNVSVGQQTEVCPEKTTAEGITAEKTLPKPLKLSDRGS